MTSQEPDTVNQAVEEGVKGLMTELAGRLRQLSLESPIFIAVHVTSDGGTPSWFSKLNGRRDDFIYCGVVQVAGRSSKTSD